MATGLDKKKEVKKTKKSIKEKRAAKREKKKTVPSTIWLKKK